MIFPPYLWIFWKTFFITLKAGAQSGEILFPSKIAGNLLTGIMLRLWELKISGHRISPGSTYWLCLSDVFSHDGPPVKTCCRLASLRIGTQNKLGAVKVWGRFSFSFDENWLGTWEVNWIHVNEKKKIKLSARKLNGLNFAVYAIYDSLHHVYVCAMPSADSLSIKSGMLCDSATLLRRTHYWAICHWIAPLFGVGSIEFTINEKLPSERLMVSFKHIVFFYKVPLISKSNKSARCVPLSSH